MKTITYDEFAALGPCWLEEDGGKARLRAYFDRHGGRMSALDILGETDVTPDDRLWAVCQEKLIDAPVLHEFACRCAERALALINNPDPRSAAAIAAKRAWLRGEITADELAAARAAARASAGVSWASAGNAAGAAAGNATWAVAWASARASAGNAARAAAWASAWASARASAGNAARAAERDWQIAELRRMILEDADENTD